jgi:hypothetical protein
LAAVILPQGTQVLTEYHLLQKHCHKQRHVTTHVDYYNKLMISSFDSVLNLFSK